MSEREINEDREKLLCLYDKIYAREECLLLDLAFFKYRVRSTRISKGLRMVVRWSEK